MLLSQASVSDLSKWPLPGLQAKFNPFTTA